MRRKKLTWKGLLKFFGPALFVFFLFNVVDPRAVADLLKKIRLDIVLISFLLFPIVTAAVTLRWWMICRFIGLDASFARLFQVYYACWFISALPVSGIGAVAKVIYFKGEGKPIGRTIISLTLEKFFDVICLILFCILSLTYIPNVLLQNKLLWPLFIGIIIVVFSLLIFGNRIWESLRLLLKRYLNRRLMKVGRNFGASLTEILKDFNLSFFITNLGISILIELLRSLVLFVISLSLDINVPFGLIIACNAFIGAANIIPVSNSGLGTRDAILLLLLPLSSVSREAALALGFAVFLWTIGLKFSGIVFWLKRPLPLNGILDIKEKLFHEPQ